MRKSFKLNKGRGLSWGLTLQEARKKKYNLPDPKPYGKLKVRTFGQSKSIYKQSLQRMQQNVN